MVIMQETDSVVTTLLQELLRFQERYIQKHPTKVRAHETATVESERAEAEAALAAEE